VQADWGRAIAVAYMTGPKGPAWRKPCKQG
jgi:hypothetical protein